MKTAPAPVSEPPRSPPASQSRGPGTAGPADSQDLFALLLGDLTGASVAEPVLTGAEPSLATAPADADLLAQETDDTADDPTLPFLALLAPPSEPPAQLGTPAEGVRPAAEGNPGALHTAPAQRTPLTDPRATARRQAQPPDATDQLPLPAATATGQHTPWSPSSTIGQSATAQLATQVPAQAESPVQAWLAGTALGDLQPGSDGGSARQGTHPGTAWVDAAGQLRSTAEGAGAETPPDFAMSLGEALGDAYEALGAEVSLWNAAQTKKASLRLDLGRAEALEVDVSVNDGKAQLAFRTDDAAVREALRAQASTVLAEQLARAGLALEGLSVGAQGQDGSAQRGGANGSERSRPWVLASTAAREGDALAEIAHGRNGLSISRGLDVYA